MTRDRAAVKKIVARAAPLWLTRSLRCARHLSDAPESGLESAEAEDAVDRIEPGDDALADQVAQRLRGAAAQRAVAGAAIESRHRELVGEAVAAMHLDGLAGDPERHLVAGHLGDRGQQRIGERVGAGAGAIEHAARGLDLTIHLGDLPADALEIGD